MDGTGQAALHSSASWYAAWAGISTLSLKSYIIVQMSEQRLLQKQGRPYNFARKSCTAAVNTGWRLRGNVQYGIL
jgi:hypothetical protein